MSNLVVHIVTTGLWMVSYIRYHTGEKLLTKNSRRRCLCDTRKKYLVMKYLQATESTSQHHGHVANHDTSNILTSLDALQHNIPGSLHFDATRHNTTRHNNALRGSNLTRECLQTNLQRSLCATTFLSLDNIWPPCQAMCNCRAGLPNLQATGTTILWTEHVPIFV
jgi:hypothetical protein